jgi:hypothetical protein
MIVFPSPASNRPSQRGIRRGGGAPITRASSGSATDTGAGSSSTTLYRPGSPPSTAAAVAAAASWMCTSDQIPAPLPTIGKRRFRTISTCSPSGFTARDVPGP